jgi:hypothetical protein
VPDDRLDGTYAEGTPEGPGSCFRGVFQELARDNPLIAQYFRTIAEPPTLVNREERADLEVGLHTGKSAYSLDLENFLFFALDGGLELLHFRVR